MEFTNILTSDYSRANWNTLLNNIFGTNFQATANPDVISADNKIAKSAFQLGEITLADGNRLAVYEVELQNKIHVNQNRVTIRNLLRSQWNKYDGAFIANYKQSDKDWRFSFVSETRQWNADGTKYEKASTDSKRYTYLLGENETARTANERFTLLRQKSKDASLNNVNEAFSVEALSNEFFDIYKEHYQNIVEFFTGERVVKKNGKWETIKTKEPDNQLIWFFNGDKKVTRDFCKKLLGRIVFLYFLQKKGWLGASNKTYQDGDKNFMYHYFEATKSKETFYSDLCKLFFDTLNNVQRGEDNFVMPNGLIVKIPFLNGGLFEQEYKNEWLLTIPEDFFQRFLTFLNQYNFTIYEDDPNDRTIAIDPNMLGHIFENLLEDNKDKGAYYTPKEIVHYMCQESLIGYLAAWFQNKGYKILGHTELGSAQSELFPVNENRKQLVLVEESKTKQIDKTIIEKLLKKQLNEEDNNLIKQHIKEFHAALDEVKICDPAIGSGAFPMGLLQEIFSTKQILHLFEYGSLESFNASEVKLNIIQNSIYGVDIEKGAVDIARLRFWLSLIIDEELPKPLPNLDYKIVVGDSLVSKFENEVIDIDWSLNLESKGFMGEDLLQQEEKIKLLQRISEKQKSYFRPQSDKKQLNNEIRNLKIDLLINQLELMININKDFETQPVKTNFKDNKKFLLATDKYFQVKGWKQHIQKLKNLKNQPEQPLNFFDWKLDFPEMMNPILTGEMGRLNSATKVGFDIVIGNPPYVSAPTMVDTNIEGRKAILNSKHFTTLYQKWDLYIPFIELGLQLLTGNGIFTMIVPYPLTNQTYAKKLREFIESQYNLTEIVDLNGTKVFENATVSNCIPFIINSKLKKSCYISHINENKQIIKTFKQTYFDLVQDEKTSVWNLTQEKRETRRHSGMNILGDFCYISVGMVLNANEKTARGEFLKDDLISETCDVVHCRKYIEAKDIERYRVKNIRYLEYNTERCPDKLRRATFRELYDNPKLMFNRLGNLMVFYDENTKFLHSDSMFSAVLWKDLKRIDNKSINASVKRYSRYSRKEMEMYSEQIDLRYLLGILNSKYASVLLSNLRGGDYHIYPEHLRNLPIPSMTMNQQQPFITLVNQILSAKQSNSAADTAAWEQEIDLLVYGLYGLTKEEIEIIEKY